MQNAVVVARNESSGAVSKAATDQQGKFSLADLPLGSYTVEVSVPGFALASRQGVKVGAEQPEELSIALALGSVSDAITVEANASGSIAAQFAPIDGLLEARSARTEVTPMFIQNFTSPVSDFSELLQMAPGTFSVNSNGVGLGDSKTFFRGFADGNYDIDYDAVPFYDTNDPTHHSWAFFPSPWIGSVDFDRSPGTASTTGPTPFGGSIHLLSRDLAASPSIRGTVSYGSFNTILADGAFDSGPFGFGGNKKSNLFADVHRLTSDGFQTFNFQTRNAGSLKYQYKFSENNVLTFYSGVVRLNSNTPNSKGPTRAQIAQYGYKFLLSNDNNATELNAAGNCISATSCLYPLNFGFYTYNVPTDLEYIDWKKEFGGGWQLNLQPYTLSYYNAQFYNNSLTSVTSNSAVDKLNSYRKYGNNLAVSQVSKFGVFRAGLWYEYAATNRYQVPSDPRTRLDTPLPNFHERFYTNSYQPFVEYEFHATRRLTVTGGFKYAFFHQALSQYQDNGTTVGCLGGTLVGGKTGNCVGGLNTIGHSAGYNSYLPSVDASYRVKTNWSVYGQFATGTKVPPSSVFDVTGANVSLLPKPTSVKTYQAGTALKLKQVTLNGDVYYIRFQNAFTAVPDPNAPTATIFTSSGDAISKGFESEANFYITRGLSFYANGTVGQAKYASKTLPNSTGVQVVNPNYGFWVASTPSNTEAFGLSYQQKYFDVAIFDKRVGPTWNDNKGNTKAAGTPATINQAIPIDPFSVTDLYVNFTVRAGSHFDQSKLRFSVNNLFNVENIIGITAANAGTLANPYPTTQNGVLIDGGDQLALMPGRSFTVTFTLGYAPKR